MFNVVVVIQPTRAWLETKLTIFFRTSGRSPNQVLTHAARAAAKQLSGCKAAEVPFQAPLVAVCGAREGLGSVQSKSGRLIARSVICKY